MDKINPMQVLAEKKEKVDKKIFELLPEEKHDIPEIQNLFKMMRDYPSRGGKRLRPALCMLSTKMLGGEKEEDVLTTAAALEMFQDWVLIHDDIEDESEERRDMPALHKIYGIAQAINAGDALHITMWETLLKNQPVLGNEKTFKIMKAFTQMLMETTKGQAMEMSWVENKKWDLTEEDYYEMSHRKTAWYTSITPIICAAIINGKDNLIPGIIEFGKDFGVAFQVQDDILNLTADGSGYGKEIAGDIYEGKRTLMLIHLLENCSVYEKAQVIAIMNKKRADKSRQEVKLVLDLMKKYKSIEYAKKKASEYAQKAHDIFEDKMKSVPECYEKNVLRSLIDFVINREL